MVAVLEDLHGKARLGDHVEQVKFRIIVGSEATFREPIFVAPFDCELREVSVINSTLVSGAATNFVALNLIDGGPDNSVLQKLSGVMPFYDRSIDMVILTHPDSDHSTGILDVLGSYEVGLILDNGIEKENPVYKILF